MFSSRADINLTLSSWAIDTGRHMCFVRRDVQRAEAWKSVALIEMSSFALSSHRLQSGALINLMQIWRLLISINWISFNQRNEPHHEQEHVKISNTAKFQSCRQDTREMVDIKKKKKRRDKCMAVSLLTGHPSIALCKTVASIRAPLNP